MERDRFHMTATGILDPAVPGTWQVLIKYELNESPNDSTLGMRPAHIRYPGDAQGMND